MPVFSFNTPSFIGNNVLLGSNSVRPSEREFLATDELNRLAKMETGSPITKQTFMFCCFTGLRHSDMVALRWGNIKETDNGLMLHVASMQKTKQPVIVPLNEKALEWLPVRPAGCKADIKVFANAPTLGCANRALRQWQSELASTSTSAFTARITPSQR